MAQIHFEVDDELHRLMKVNAAGRGETIRDAMTCLAWWYVDGTDDLLLDACQETLDADELTPDLLALVGAALGRAEMRQQRGGGEEG